jgi:hypothetical protein
LVLTAQYDECAEQCLGEYESVCGNTDRKPLDVKAGTT